MPSAPFLYEVASYVKNCHSGHYYIIILPYVLSFLWPCLYPAFACVQHISTSSLLGIMPSVHVCHFPDVYISHMIQSCLSSCPPQHAHFSCEQLSLLLPSDSPTSSSVHHSRFYSRLVHIVFQLCWYVPVAHHYSCFPSI